jgi:phospholipase A1
MRIVVLVPGIMGSRLTLNGEEIWPPTIPELKFGYHRLGKLLDPAAKPTDVIRQVISCYQVYGSLIDQVKIWGFAEQPQGGSAGSLVCWHYDWRIDNRVSAAQLSAKLADERPRNKTRCARQAYRFGRGDTGGTRFSQARSI